jgi:isopentenyl phosphate kinase
MLWDDTHILFPLYAAPSSMQTLYVVYLDRHHLGDELFLKSLAQSFAEGASGEPACILVHSSGEKVERTLESKGYFPERTDGVLDVESEEQRQLVERAVRETNQEIVATLTDEVVSAVGIQGVDRNLLGLDEEGRITASNVGWLAALLKQRVVPVVSALVESDDAGTHEVWAADVVVALAKALTSSFDPVACGFTTVDQPGLHDASGMKDEISVDGLDSTDEIPEPESLRRLHQAGIPVLITNVQGLLGGEEPRGTRLSPAE